MKKLFIILCLITFLSSCGKDGNELDIKIEILKDKARKINVDFKNIKNEVKMLSIFTEKLYDEKIAEQNLSKVDKSKYKLMKNGVFYKADTRKGSAVFVSGYVPVDENVKRSVYITEVLDENFENISQRYEELAQVYYNDKNSYNRIYPPFDVLSQYEVNMNIPSFNFYYLADNVNNPKRNALWVKEPYVDPAGRGWMVSAISPVYLEDSLEGVAGIDITIDVITKRYLEGAEANYMIISSEGVIVSTSESIINLFLFPKLKSHKYIETIKEDTYRGDDYNILKSKYKDIRNLGKKIIFSKEKKIKFEKEKKKYFVLKEDIEELDWKIITIYEK